MSPALALSAGAKPVNSIEPSPSTSPSMCLAISSAVKGIDAWKTGAAVRRDADLVHQVLRNREAAFVIEARAGHLRAMNLRLQQMNLHNLRMRGWGFGVMERWKVAPIASSLHYSPRFQVTR